MRYFPRPREMGRGNCADADYVPDTGPIPRLASSLPSCQRLRLTWAGLAGQIGCTSSRLTNLRTARMADMALVMRVTQWLRRPAAEFIHPAGSRHRADLL